MGRFRTTGNQGYTHTLVIRTVARKLAVKSLLVMRAFGDSLSLKNFRESYFPSILIIGRNSKITC